MKIVDAKISNRYFTPHSRQSPLYGCCSDGRNSDQSDKIPYNIITPSDDLSRSKYYYLFIINRLAIASRTGAILSMGWSHISHLNKKYIPY